jgi:hypothetical protein
MWDDELILPINYRPTIAEFLGVLGLKPRGLGAQLFTAAYNQFFVWSTDLRDEYQRYYCVEYPTFDAYLQLAHDLELEPAELEKKYILKIRSTSGVVDRAYDDSSLDTVLECIRKLEEMHED